MPKKALLIIQATPDAMPRETEHILSVGHVLWINGDVCEVYSMAALRELLPEYKDVKYLYLAAHSGPLGFRLGNRPEEPRVGWPEFGRMLSDAGCLAVDAVLFLACCYAGRDAAAESVLTTCPNISLLCGPVGQQNPKAMALAFHAFLYNLVVRKEDPARAARRASIATKAAFACHQR